MEEKDLELLKELTEKDSDLLKMITPQWAWLKDINKAKEEGRIFESKEGLLNYIDTIKEKRAGINYYYCSECNVYVIGYPKHQDYLENASHMSSYEIMQGIRASKRGGLCEFCNSIVHSAVL